MSSLRPTRLISCDGRLSFVANQEKIWENLLQARDSTVMAEIMLRIHVSGSNVSGLGPLIKNINESFSGCDKFKVHFHRISNLGGPGAAEVHDMPMSEYQATIDRLQKQLKLGATSEVSLVQDGYICYAAKPNSLLIRADGRIGKCTVALNDSRNDVGVLRSDGKIDFHNRRLKLWFEGFREQRVEELSCPLAYLGQDSEEKAIPLALVSKKMEVVS